MSERHGTLINIVFIVAKLGNIRSGRKSCVRETKMFLAGRGGEICVYLNNAMPCKRRLDLENPIFECLWLILRPKRLPRPLSGIAICVVYHPQVDLLKVIKD